ncbi:MAG TPA: GxGYxYP domain-containing protein [Candidatus Deferrimicrobium sp.]|nr:GxGYxYP domain-containing protein [Candidatus Deferrimicrobium sp.]
MVLSRGKKAFLIGFISLVILGIGIIPTCIPPNIYDYNYINWHGADLTSDITGDSTYFDNFPNFTTPSELDAYDIRALPYDQQLVLTTLQGLVNKENTSLYFIYRESDAFWLDRLKEYYGVNYTISSYASYWNIIEKYNTSIKGVIIYDENLLDTVNVATFLAGVNECVVIHPSMLYNFSTFFGLSALYDFRGNFTSRLALYTWAFENYWPIANQKMIASRPPETTSFRDYIVAANIFTFWVHVGPFGDPAEIELFRRIMTETPQNIPVWGWFSDPGGALGEYEAVKTISHNGKYSLCAAIPDLTVLSAFKDPLLTQKPISFNASSYPLENKIYVALIVSDGDNVDYCQNYLLNEIWQNPDRGTVPLGITLEPLMAKISPIILKYYYENATANEYFLAGPSGAGYCYVDMTPTFPNYLNRTKYAMDQSDMRQVWLLNGYEGYEVQYSEEILNAYTSPKCNFTGIYLNYHDFQAEANSLVNDVPVFHSIWVEGGNELIGKLNSIAYTKPDYPIFVFVGWNSWDFNISTAKYVYDTLPNDTYTFLRPDQFAELFTRYQLELTSENWMNETIVLSITLVLFIGVVILLALLWLFSKQDSNQKQESISNGFRHLLKLFYVIIDVSLLLTVNFCLYSTILSVIYLLFLIISLFFGIQLKRVIEKSIGVRETFCLSLSLLTIGFFLFAISPQFIIVIGFPLGILLSRQIQSNHLVYNSPELGKKSFFYSLIIAAVIILLIPFQYYALLIWIIAFIFIGIAFPLIFLFKNSHLILFNDFSNQIRYSYLKGVCFGILLFFLLSPTYAPERYFFSILWGLENFPTKLTIAFSIATIYLSAILIFEFLRLKNISLSKMHALFLTLVGFLCYIILPFYFQNVIVFFGSILLYIFGLVVLINALVISSLPYLNLHELANSPSITGKDPRGFISQFSFWLIIGLFIFFIPQTVLVIDSQEAFSFIGLTGINQLSWSPLMWTCFYTPSIYTFLAIPLTAYVLIVGLIRTIAH